MLARPIYARDWISNICGLWKYRSRRVCVCCWCRLADDDVWNLTHNLFRYTNSSMMRVFCDFAIIIEATRQQDMRVRINSRTSPRSRYARPNSSSSSSSSSHHVKYKCVYLQRKPNTYTTCSLHTRISEHRRESDRKSPVFAWSWPDL